MNAEFLRTAPISGSVEERTFSPSAGYNAWVRFEDEQGNEWVGIFGGGDTSVSTVAPFGDDGGRTVLVIAGGAAYIVDTVQRELVREPNWTHATTAVGIPGRAFVAVANDTEAWFAYRDHDQAIWRADPVWPEPGARPSYRRIALDGIRFDYVRAGRLCGKVWQVEGWYALEVDLDTARASVGAFLTGEWSAFAATNATG